MYLFELSRGPINSVNELVIFRPDCLVSSLVSRVGELTVEIHQVVKH